ncbi:hypothetical protein, partial [Apibacter muscae]|uniref:hypothetical protein n=1 Tax=Apibacter muscae TaxID=2509004 RepID=UPI001624442A
KDSFQYGQYIINAVKILDIQNGVYWFSHNPNTDGRFHHNLLNLNKKFRKYITYDNQRLVEFDLSNSTPFILASLLANNFTIDINNYINNNTLINTKTYFSKNTLVSYMSEKIPEYISNKEIQDFLDSCIKGDIYLSISEEYLNKNIHSFYENHFFDWKTGERTYTDEDLKKVVKKDFLGMLFAENKDFQPMQEAFKKSYPGIYSLLFEIKQEFPYQSLSYLLFQVESYVMLELLARDFNNKNRGRLPFFTFHDCLVVQESKEQMLEDYMKVRLAEIYKKPPHFKFKKW